MTDFPRRIICLTEESLEILHHLGELDRVVGVSAYVERPCEAKGLPVVCAFTGGSVKKIVDVKADLVIGYSDMQKDLARDLIAEGENVYISNHRSLEEIFDYIMMISRLIGRVSVGKSFVLKLKKKIEKAKEVASKFNKRPKVYIEEWDEPQICGSRWFSEIVEVCGGECIHKEKSKCLKGSERIISSDELKKLGPEIVLASWCGKNVDIESIKKREGLENCSVYELDPIIFLQPGPAPILDGIDILIEIIQSNQ